VVTRGNTKIAKRNAKKESGKSPVKAGKEERTKEPYAKEDESGRKSFPLAE
jgi:hypothetical protein